ncbi:MAG: hypothetical protein EOM20_03385, partial [Spartobacteria bacterium]|nr:hypothetical protein [Spartobacteria bacterium]
MPLFYVGDDKYDIPENKRSAFLKDVYDKGFEAEPAEPLTVLGNVYDMPLSKKRKFVKYWEDRGEKVLPWEPPQEQTPSLLGRAAGAIGEILPQAATGDSPYPIAPGANFAPVQQNKPLEELTFKYEQHKQEAFDESLPPSARKVSALLADDYGGEIGKLATPLRFDWQPPQGPMQPQPLNDIAESQRITQGDAIIPPSRYEIEQKEAQEQAELEAYADEIGAPDRTIVDSLKSIAPMVGVQGAKMVLSADKYGRILNDYVDSKIKDSKMASAVKLLLESGMSGPTVIGELLADKTGYIDWANAKKDDLLTMANIVAGEQDYQLSRQAIINPNGIQGLIEQAGPSAFLSSALPAAGMAV